MVDQYGRVKRFLPAVLCDLYFQAGRTYTVCHSLSDRTERLEKAHPGHISLSFMVTNIFCLTHIDQQILITIEKQDISIWLKDDISKWDLHDMFIPI